MEKDKFYDHLLKATGHSFDLARQFVRDHLPDSFSYLAYLNESYDGNPLEAGERVYPDDVVRFGKPVGPLTAQQVVELLWRDGLVPEWVDISVVRTEGDQTFMQLLCCGRFTDREEHLYYSHSGVCPFGCKSPVVPPHWEIGDEPFDLQWRANRDS